MAADAKTVELLGSKVVEDRLRAVRRLGRSPSTEDLRLLVSALRDRARYVASEAARLLADAATWEIGELLLAHFAWANESGVKRDPGCTVRAHLATALARARYTPAIDILRSGTRAVQPEGMHDTAVLLRGNCALALAHMDAPDALRDVGLLLFRTACALDTADRVAAARAIATLRDPVGAVLLHLRLEPPDGDVPEVLAECMQSLVALEDERALEVLGPYLRRGDSLGAFAALMLSRTDRLGVAEAIIEAVSVYKGEDLEAMLTALRQCRSDRAQTALREWARSGSGPLARAARAVIGVETGEAG